MRSLAPLPFALGLAFVGCRGQARPDTGGVSRNLNADTGSVTSNITRADYVGSAACQPCHAREYRSWHDSPMRRMTRNLRQTQIAAPFTGETFTFRGDSVKMEQLGRNRFMRLRQAAGDESLFRVSKVIGGRLREDFVGVEVNPNAPLGQPLSEERVLPVSYLSFNGEWRYKGYSVMVRERPGLRPGVVWRQSCIFCHNTVPSLSLWLDDLHGPGAHAYQGSVSVDLPDDKRPRYVVRDEPALKSALSSELAYLGQEQELASDNLQRALTASIDATRDHFGEKDLVEVGIGCEACHGGSKEHAEDPMRVRPTFAVRSEFLAVESPTGRQPTRAENINRTCAKCHTVLFSRYPYTWEGHSRRHDPGGSSINSGEARDFLLGDCNSQLSCARCHDPHTEDSKGALDALAGPSGDALCTSCHQQFQGEVARRAHTHHEPTSSGSHCLNCHMPKKNMGLAYELTRYHRIGSPTDRERVEGDRPLECALCHTDKSVESLVSTMERFWGKKYDRGALRRLYGADLNINALEATLTLGKPHEQAVAVAIAGRDRRRDLLPQVVAVLGNDYPLVRFFARHAIERITGAALSIDMNASGPELVQSAEKYLATHGTQTSSVPTYSGTDDPKQAPAVR